MPVLMNVYTLKQLCLGIGAVVGGACLSAGLTPLSAASPLPGLGLHAGRDDSIAQYEAFGDWLGRRVMYRIVFCDMSSWNGIASPWFIGTSRQWIDSDPQRVEVITVPLLPKGEEENFATIIAGERDAVFRSLAEKIQSRGLAARVIIRLGWEGNGDWYPWTYARNPAGYRAAFRQAVMTMRTVTPELRFDWCVSSRCSRKGGPAVWTDGYPGDDVVDIISMDTYDEYQPSWQALLDGEAGLREFREFAIARGKPEAYPEWGCSVNASAQGGGDNVAFVENMAEWFQGRPGKVVYQAYWNVSTGGPNAPLFGVQLVPVPNAAAAYRRLFSRVAAPSVPTLR